MVNYSRVGLRCRTLFNVLTAKGLLPRGTQGTWRSEHTTLLGRRVVLVDWDNGLRVAVAPHEIAILKPEVTTG